MATPLTFFFHLLRQKMGRRAGVYQSIRAAEVEVWTVNNSLFGEKSDTTRRAHRPCLALKFKCSFLCVLTTHNEATWDALHPLLGPR